MGMIRCTRCGRNEDEASASFTEQGLVCQSCYQGERDRDNAQAMAGDAAGAMMLGGAGLNVIGGLGGLASTVSMELSMSSSQSSTRGGLPGGGLHDALLARGLQCQRFLSSEGNTVAGVSTSGRTGYRETWLLTRAPGLQASFASEGLLQKLGKVFTRELQTGDADFDAAVYIKTGTRDATAAWLQRPDVRARVLALVKSGGQLTIDDTMVEGQVWWSATEPMPGGQELVAGLVASLLEPQ